MYVAASPKLLHTSAYTIAEAVGMHTAGEAAQPYSVFTPTLGTGTLVLQAVQDVDTHCTHTIP